MEKARGARFTVTLPLTETTRRPVPSTERFAEAVI
jgi:hypothetical protein